MCLDLRVEMRVQKEGLAEAPAGGGRVQDWGDLRCVPAAS